MKKTKIAKRYATALFDLAFEQEILEQIKSDMELVVSICQQNKDFRQMLQSPIIYTGKKEAVIQAVFKGHIQQMSLFFLLIITKKRRESVLETIAQQFVVLYKEFKNITTAKLETAVELDQPIREEVIGLLQKQTKGEIELIEKVNKKLIGGFVLSYDDKQYDASIKKQIKELQRDFKENSYVKVF
jgi:F-type H+-transporting ATPase subunit delta